MLKYSSLAHLINMYLINNFKKGICSATVCIVFKTKLEVNVIYLLQHQPSKHNENKN